MRRILCLDTETSGLPNWPAPDTDQTQPHCLEFAYIFAEERRIVMRGNLYVFWPNIEYGHTAMQVNGLTPTFLGANGLTPRAVFNIAGQLISRADLIVGHSIAFDLRILRIMAARVERLEAFDGLLAERHTFCTQKQSTPILQLPKKPGDHRSYSDSSWKYPKLLEAHKHFFGAEFEGAHGATADAEATWKVFWAIEEWIATQANASDEHEPDDDAHWDTNPL